MVLQQMERIAAAGDGWVNFLPDIENEYDARPTVATGLAAILGPRQVPVTLATWLPVPRRARSTGRRPAHATLGILHPMGRGAVGRLASVGIEVAPDWVVVQDHARRGLLLHLPPTVAASVVLEFAVRAGTELSAARLTGGWEAEVYLPLDG